MQNYGIIFLGWLQETESHSSSLSERRLRVIFLTERNIEKLSNPASKKKESEKTHEKKKIRSIIESIYKSLL